jgi:hypothetical protein
MLTASLYLFAASVWGAGLLTWVVVLSHKVRVWELEAQDKALELEQKKQLFSRFSQMSGKGTIAAPVSKEVPEKIKELMKSSPNHPEVEEIDGSDQILGVRFEAENYPPGFGGDADEG